jgi:hypothetical protein
VLEAVCPGLPFNPSIPTTASICTYTKLILHNYTHPPHHSYIQKPLSGSLIDNCYATTTQCPPTSTKPSVPTPVRIRNPNQPSQTTSLHPQPFPTPPTHLPPLNQPFLTLCNPPSSPSACASGNPFPKATKPAVHIHPSLYSPTPTPPTAPLHSHPNTKAHGRERGCANSHPFAD